MPFFPRQECPWEETAYPQVSDSIIQAYDDLASGKFSTWQAEMTASRYTLRQISEQLVGCAARNPRVFPGRPARLC